MDTISVESYLKQEIPMAVPSVGMRVLDALTREQMVHLLDTVVGVWGGKGMHELLGALDEDVASTLTRVMDPEAAPGERIVSDDKKMEEWRGLRHQWEEIVSELGGEDRRYAEYEHHWEEPYFAAEAFMYDLDLVAEQMVPLVESIYEIGDEEDDWFEGALADIEDGIKGYPDWMGADQDYCTLGSQTSHCVLKWGQLAAGSAGDLIARIAEMQGRLKIVKLNSGATIEFFRSLPEEDRMEIYSALNEHRREPFWQAEFESSLSPWHQIYYGFRQTYDHEGYIEDCKRLLHQYWHYGLPVIEQLVSVGQIAEAERIAEDTMASLLKKRWLPEETLLLSVLSSGAFFRFRREDVIHLLTQWISLAEQLHNEERAASLKFQRVAWEDPGDWAAIAECYHAFSRLPFPHTVERLLDQWKKHVLRAQLGWSLDRRGISDDCWVMWLLEEAMSEAPDEERFFSKADEWLQSMLETTEGDIGRQTDLLSMLTCDLMHYHEPAARYRCLHAVICQSEASAGGGKEMTANRRAWLQRIGAEQLTPFVIQCWRTHLSHIMPDPGQSSGSLYTHHAQWLAALNELDPSACRKVLNHWKEAHKRRRNLWKAIHEQGLTV